MDDDRFSARDKNVGLAVVLAVVLGPLGMLYSTAGGALVMLLLGGAFAAVTLGAGLVFVVPVCAIWAASSAASHNQRLHGRAARRWAL